MRLAASLAVLLAGTPLFLEPLLFAAPPPAATAVFSLDAQHRDLVDSEADSLADQLNRWASACTIEPVETSAKLLCRPLPETPETPGSADKVPATVALFLDLDETLYIAACPFIEEESSAPDAAAKPAADGPSQLELEDRRNCRDIEAGQTFTTEVEGDTLRIVIRGRQLALRIFDTQEKPRTISTPYVPTPSTRMPKIGPDTTGERKGLEAQNEPRWEPPQLSSPSSGNPSQSRSEGIEPARTSLKTGRVTIECPSREAVVIIDGAYMGNCPFTTTLVAGPHTLVVRQPGQAEQMREVRIEAGKTFRWRVKH